MADEPTDHEDNTAEPTALEAVQIEERSFWDKVASAAGQAGREAIEKALTLYYVLIDRGTPVWAKSVIVGALGYFISPVDAIPDVLVGIGYTDDLGVMAAALAAVAVHIKREHTERAQDWVKRNLG